MQPLPPLEPPAPARAVLVLVGAVGIGVYLLLAVLAVSERAHWAVLLAIVPGLLFALAAFEASRLLRRR